MAQTRINRLSKNGFKSVRAWLRHKGGGGKDRSVSYLDFEAEDLELLRIRPGKEIGYIKPSKIS